MREWTMMTHNTTTDKQSINIKKLNLNKASYQVKRSSLTLLTICYQNICIITRQMQSVHSQATSRTSNQAIFIASWTPSQFPLLLIKNLSAAIAVQARHKPCISTSMANRTVFMNLEPFQKLCQFSNLIQLLNLFCTSNVLSLYEHLWQCNGITLKSTLQFPSEFWIHWNVSFIYCHSKAFKNHSNSTTVLISLSNSSQASVV